MEKYSKFNKYKVMEIKIKISTSMKKCEENHIF